VREVKVKKEKSSSKLKKAETKKLNVSEKSKIVKKPKDQMTFDAF